VQVDSSTLALQSSHIATDSSEVQENLTVRLPSVEASPASPSPSSTRAAGFDSTNYLDTRTALLLWVYEFFTGAKAHLITVDANSAPTTNATPPAGATAPSWGVSYTRQETHQEAETTSFSADGTVKLKSGETVSFSLNLEMNRQLTEAKSFSFRAGNMADPIAVNLDGTGARLSGQKTPFDLNGDGVNELIATLAEGSAWLAQDVNGDGKVNSGAELFGPASGNGFQELAAQDTDHNGWIDAGDPAYSRMGLWQDGTFTSLHDAGIGALATGSVATPFTQKDGTGLLGQTRQSGVYLNEDGTPGALQQIDLKI